MCVQGSDYSKEECFLGFKGGQVNSIEGMDLDSICVVMVLFLQKFVWGVGLCEKFNGNMGKVNYTEVWIYVQYVESWTD